MRQRALVDLMCLLARSLQLLVILQYCFLVGPETECRTPGVQSFYVPSDERFDYIKSSDNKANAARANGHAAEAASKIMAAKDESDNKSSSSFQSIEQVKQLLYASSSSSSSPPPKHKHDIGAPGSTNVSGEKNNQLLFPLPQILQGGCSSLRCS